MITGRKLNKEKGCDFPLKEPLVPKLDRKIERNV